MARERSQRFAFVALAAAAVLLFSLALTTSQPRRLNWRLVRAETFDAPLNIDDAPWVRDPQGDHSDWNVDAFDDDGQAWRAMSGPTFSAALRTFDIYRKRVRFGEAGWLTAEIAAQDKNLDGRPDSEPGLRRVSIDGDGAAQIWEPSWDAGVLVRPTRPLPPRYRIEVTLRSIDFGGRRNGSLHYDGKENGYRPRSCVTSYPWTFAGAEPGKDRCNTRDVTDQNGFYFLTVLDYATPAPHSNPDIHFHRKVNIDAYNSTAPWSRRYGVCNPASGKVLPVQRSNLNAVNAVFVRGDRFRKGNNNVSNEYYYKTSCGNWSGDATWGKNGRLHDILSTAELQPEQMPEASYRFAIERDRTGYTIEMRGPFRYTGMTTLRYHHDFVENGRPIWHYNQTSDDYDGQFDQRLIHTGPTGSYITRHTWPQGSAYPDSFIIGDPHLNFYEGDAVIDNIKLYVPTSSP